MTYVMNIAAASLNSNNSLKFWTIEVITYDQESIIVEVEARTAEEAQAKAADEELKSYRESLRNFIDDFVYQAFDDPEDYTFVGWRNVKILASGECRKIRDCCIFRINGLEIFL